MQIIPVVDTPSQSLAVILDGQQAQFDLYQKSTGLFCDVTINGTVLCEGIICRNLVKIVRGVYLGMQGDVFFNDTQGTNDPSYPGLGARYQFVYLEVSNE